MAQEASPDTVDEYIAGFPPQAQNALAALRGLVATAAPGATETIRYGMPTLDLHGHHLLHFAGFAKHVALYPVPDWVAAFSDEAAAYISGQGTLKFALSEPLPDDLIRRIVEYCVAHTGEGSY